MLYMVTFTINIPPMLAYIPAPWILWVATTAEKATGCWEPLGADPVMDADPEEPPAKALKARPFYTWTNKSTVPHGARICDRMYAYIYVIVYDIYIYIIYYIYYIYIIYII